MKRVFVITVLIAILQANAPAFTLTENFDSGGAGWGASGITGTSSFSIVTDGAGKHLSATVVRDVNDGVGRFVKALGTTLNLSAVGSSIYLEADVQPAAGFQNFGSIYLGLGNSANNDWTNQAVVRVYWDGGYDQYSIYGNIYDSSSSQLMVEGANRTGMPGVPYRVKARFTVVAGPYLQYDVSVFNINGDGSTGSLVGSATATQIAGSGALSVDQVGIFIQNTTISASRYIVCNIDNIYVSDTGFSSNIALPSWYNLTSSNTDIFEAFTLAPSPTTWTTTTPVGSGCSFTWQSRGGGGFMDVILARRTDSSDPTKAARFTRQLGKEFAVDNATTNPGAEAYGIYWFMEFDTYIFDSDALAEGLIGTGSTRYSGPFNDQNLGAAAWYGAQESGDGIRALLVGYGNTYPTSRRATTMVGLLTPGNTYRVKFAVVQSNKRTRMIGSVYTVNPDGTDGSLVAVQGGYQSTSSDGLYADLMGIFSTIQTTTTTRSMEIYVDNMHFSDVGFKLTGVKPTWLSKPLCSELTTPMTGDIGGAGGAGNYDCAINMYDLKILADNWLRVGN